MSRNEIDILNQIEMVELADNLLVDAMNGITDLTTVLNDSEDPRTRTAIRAINAIVEDLADARMGLARHILNSKEDGRNERLDELKDQFNIESGTWYEQVEKAFTERTGFESNKWAMLLWTIYLANGKSTFQYLVDDGYITKDENGNYNASTCGDTEKLQQLINEELQERR